MPQYGDLGTPTKPKPLDILKEYDTAPSDWSSDTGSGPGYEVIKLERVIFKRKKKKKKKRDLNSMLIAKVDKQTTFVIPSTFIADC